MKERSKNIQNFTNYSEISDLTDSDNSAVKESVWDPSESVATRPLAISIANVGTYFYTHDLTKNVCELIDTNLEIAQTYDYAPFGAVEIGIPSGGSSIANPFQFSSEVYDSELALNYYNYRHYNPADGRWLSRDPIEEQGGLNLYAFVENNWINSSDFCGMKEIVVHLKKGLQTYYGYLYLEIDDKSCIPSVKRHRLEDDISEDILNYVPLTPLVGLNSFARLIKRLLKNQLLKNPFLKKFLLAIELVPGFWLISAKTGDTIIEPVSATSKRIPCKLPNGGNGIRIEMQYKVGYTFTVEYVAIRADFLGFNRGVINQEGRVINNVTISGPCCCDKE